MIVSDYLAAPQAQLYDASTLEPIGTPFPTQPVRVGYGVPGDPMAVNGSGTMFALTADLDPLVWRVDPTSWLKIACTIAGRNLTSAEWQHYLPQRTYQRTCPQFPGPEPDHLAPATWRRRSAESPSSDTRDETLDHGGRGHVRFAAGGAGLSDNPGL